MILTIDIGNTNIVTGCFDQDQLLFLERFSTEQEATSLEYATIFKETLDLFGVDVSMNDLYGKLYNKALEGDADCGGLVSFNCYSGEPVLALDEGCPMLTRRADARFTLANLARVQLYAAMAALRVGMDILLEDEQAALDTLYGHGGLFKTPVVGQKLLAGALGVPVAVMETAGEGGPWGMALLAAYRAYRAPGQTLEEYLAQGVFAGAAGSVEAPTKTDCGGFNAFFARYRACLPAQSAAAKALAAGEG